MKQLQLFSPRAKTVLSQSAIIKSVFFNQDALLKAILRLHVKQHTFDADVTYARGAFWRHIPPPRLKFDVAPQAPGIVRADMRALPLASASLHSLVCDPPFVIRPHIGVSPNGHKKTSWMGARYGAYPSAAAYVQLYKDTLREFARVLEPRGVAVVKIQDVVSSKKRFNAHYEIMRAAQDAGFDCDDTFILVSDHVMLTPCVETQQHARQVHSYFLVFKPRLTRRMKYAMIQT